MPQTNSERQARWPGMDTQAIAYLEAHGYVLERSWEWRLPEGREKPTYTENDAIIYLMEEFDYGGWV